MENNKEEIQVRVSAFLVNLSLSHGNKCKALMKQGNRRANYAPRIPAAKKERA